MVGFVLAIGSLGVVGNNLARPSLTWWSLSLVVASAAALWWRRSHPRLVLASVVLVEVLNFVFLGGESPSGIALFFAVFAVSAYDNSPVRQWVAIAAIVVALTGIGFLLFSRSYEFERLIPSGVLSLIAWMVGDYVRSRRNFFLEVVAKHRQAREQAAEEERLRIARELHDVVAHNVSLMAIQAGAARVSGDSQEKALQSIEDSARDTLRELNKLLGVLRKSPGAPALTPQPSLDDLDSLLKPARDAGLEATLRVEGERRALSSALDMSAYRIVQEAITNVLKHANANRVEVVVDYEPDALLLTVADNGTGPLTGSNGGHGLVGMKERVDLFGGELKTGSSSLGGFVVRARLPIPN